MNYYLGDMTLNEIKELYKKEEKDKRLKISSLLAQYKHLIDLEDKMQKSNLKFVESYVSRQNKKNKNGWESDCIEFLADAIDLQKKLLERISSHRLTMNAI